MNPIKRRIFNFLMKHLFNTVTEDDVIQVVGKYMVVEGRQVTAEFKRELVSGAQSLERLLLWKQMVKEMKHVANKRMYMESTGDADMVAGKWILYAVDVMEKKISNIARLQ